MNSSEDTVLMSRKKIMGMVKDYQLYGIKLEEIKFNYEEMLTIQKDKFR